MGLAGAESATESTFLIGTAVAGVGVSNITHRVRRGEKYGQGCSRSQGRGCGGAEEQQDQDEEGQRMVSDRAKAGQKASLGGGTEQTYKLHVELRRERE